MPRNEGNVELWSQLSVLVAEVGTVLDRRVEQEYGLGMTDFLALKALCGKDRSGLRMRELAATLGLNQSSATRAVTRLEREGLAERAPDGTDGRGVVVRVTPEGRDLTAEIAGLFGDEVGAALNAAALDNRMAPVVARLLYEPEK
ncbi:MarR family transcriptional regulator [Streptomyces sp. NPDC006184]|uniref:MarR family winged helix-turn-helix transcriptional regulator n=1 Tax=Streptomyces sp. NPDC006184 TaxID=3155455 RepID=UPI00339EF37C